MVYLAFIKSTLGFYFNLSHATDRSTLHELSTVSSYQKSRFIEFRYNCMHVPFTLLPHGTLHQDG